MKKHVFLGIIFSACALNTNAQMLVELQQAIKSPAKAVQAIHHYPSNIKDGECHNVPATSIITDGETITIVEVWTNYMSKGSKTTLTGRLHGAVAEGTWKSSFSSGTWNYNFATGIGYWNKTNAPLKFGTFKKMEKLEFRIVNRKDLHDGFKVCK